MDEKRLLALFIVTWSSCGVGPLPITRA